MTHLASVAIERSRALEELQAKQSLLSESEQRFRAIFDEAGTGIALVARDTRRQEKHFILRDGRPVWANAIFTLLRDPAGFPRYVIAICEDITERKCAVEKLQAKQDLLDLAQKSARAMAFDWYIQQDVNVWSPEQEALHGLPPGSFDGTYRSWKKRSTLPTGP